MPRRFAWPAAAAFCILAWPTLGGEAPQYEMTTYQFVMLRTGPNDATLDPEESERRQLTHMQLMKRLLEDGRALIAGPISGGGDLRGVVVLNVGTTVEAERIFAEDAWVEIDKLSVEIHPWWAAKEILQKPNDAFDHASCQLGLLFRPDDSPQFSDERLQELQAGHLANIEKMAASGDLVIAGPMGDDTKLRGIFIFRTLDVERVRELVARDPSIRANRLRMDLYEWSVPKGTIPEAPSAGGRAR
jgi:uncharacterized protein YciI